jgi:hypothetical protein
MMEATRGKIEGGKEAIKIIVIRATKDKSSLEKVEIVKKGKDVTLYIPMSAPTATASIA